MRLRARSRRRFDALAPSMSSPRAKPLRRCSARLRPQQTSRSARCSAWAREVLRPALTCRFPPALPGATRGIRCRTREVFEAHGSRSRSQVLPVKDDALAVLLSGGGSALMALPAPGISLAAKQQTARTLMAQSADIYELNTVRKHLSGIKGGRLAAASSGSVLTLAVSDVVGDDLSVIASGPTVADESTFARALEVLSARGGLDAYPADVVSHLRRGAAGATAGDAQEGRSTTGPCDGTRDRRAARRDRWRAPRSRGTWLSRARRGGASHGRGAAVRESTSRCRVASIAIVASTSLRDLVW